MIAALPWILVPLVTAIRVRHSRSLADERGAPPENPPRISVVIPARNEARNIRRCLESVLESSYPLLQVIVVNDHSTDGTGDIARRIAAGDSRARVIDNPDLPAGWFGKQWACRNGALESDGEIILFTDADTRHSRDLITRSVNAIIRREAGLFSVMGAQELGSFWERLIQPQMFGIISIRYGGTETITSSPAVADKIANGQCLFVRREPYERFGGHELVKSHVADDMMMAQRFFARGQRVVIEEGLDQISTRMYTSLGEIIHGWGKNVFAAGRDAVLLGRFGRAIYPLLLLSVPLTGLLPALVIIVGGLAGFPAPILLWAAIAQAATLIWWLYVYHHIEESPFYAVIAPLGAALIFYIFLRAIVRGQRVAWKGREYVSS